VETHERTAVVEALLFASDEPLGIAAFQKVLEDLSPAEIRDALAALRAEYDDTPRGFTLLEVAGGFVLCTKESWAPWVEKLMKGRRRVRLSRAALETVAVIAYKQPIAGSEIERIRGVDASSVLATLLERDLVMIKGRGPGPGKPLLYGTTQEFLNYFGLNKLADLPRLDEVRAGQAAPLRHHPGIPELLRPEQAGRSAAARRGVGAGREASRVERCGARPFREGGRGTRSSGGGGCGGGGGGGRSAAGGGGVPVRGQIGPAAGGSPAGRGLTPGVPRRLQPPPAVAGAFRGSRRSGRSRPGDAIPTRPGGAAC
jgi:segregation and condensation protein B